MKPRKAILFFALIVAISCASPATQCTLASSAVGAAPNVFVEEFYKWYIHSVSHQIDPLQAGKPTLQKYVTPSSCESWRESRERWRQEATTATIFSKRKKITRISRTWKMN